MSWPARARIERFVRALWEGKRQGAAGRLLIILLIPLSWIYGLVMRLRAVGYRLGIIRSYRLDRPVVSVGNLTVGGTGKTPTVAFLASWFIGQGKRVAVLSRGYRRSGGTAPAVVSDGSAILMTAEESGDEPYLLAATVPGLMVVVGSDRYGAGLLAQERLNPDIFILDDGFQHLRLYRDCDIVLCDCRNPFGNRHLLPAGLLREPISALSRAQLLLLTRCDQDTIPPSVAIPAVKSSHFLRGVVNLRTGALQPFASLDGKGVAFAGIADPFSFFDALTQEGLAISGKRPLPDHAVYGQSEIDELVAFKRELDADYMITTQKDAVKLLSLQDQLGPIYAAVLEIRVSERDQLQALLEKLL